MSRQWKTPRKPGRRRRIGTNQRGSGRRGERTRRMKGKKSETSATATTTTTTTTTTVAATMAKKRGSFRSAGAMDRRRLRTSASGRHRPASVDGWIDDTLTHSHTLIEASHKPPAAKPTKPPTNNRTDRTREPTNQRDETQSNLPSFDEKLGTLATPIQFDANRFEIQLDWTRDDDTEGLLGFQIRQFGHRCFLMENTTFTKSNKMWWNQIQNHRGPEPAETRVARSPSRGEPVENIWNLGTIRPKLGKNSIKTR